jgi:surfactin synthase thioesterase subunit
VAVAAESDDDPWVRRFREAHESSPTLVCLPHAGGSASSYLALTRELAPEIEVLAIQYPGRQDRRADKSAETIAELADWVYAALGRRGTFDEGGSRPAVSLFGHSMGAVVAFEIAVRMQRDGLAPPARLFVSGRRAPSIVRDGVLLHTLDDPGLIAEMKRVGGTHRAILDDPELQELFLPTIRSDYRVIESYRYTPGPPLNCPITVLNGDSDAAVTLEEAAAWETFGTGRFDSRLYPGGHFYLEEHVPQVAELLRAEFAKGRS